MKKILLGIGMIILLGAGCAGTPPVSENSNGNENAPSANNSNAPSGEVSLQPLPEVVAPKNPIDESLWSKAVTKSGVTIAYPTKGGFAPTWTYQSLAKDDEHLKGNCYVTPDTVYSKTDFPGFTDACQTATAMKAGPATRTDYFVWKKGNLMNLLTVTKNYPANFDMDEYGATVDRLIKAIK